MSRGASVLQWLEDKSDWLSPLVVKEVRQIVRGREFMISFGLSLLAGLVVAFVGATEALRGANTAGSWTFVLLVGCLAFLGMGVAPLSAGGALRTERLELTLDLITLTALSPRRIVLGKLLAQCVKIATFFAAIAPFMTMSFLLGGIDFVTVLSVLAGMFLLSVWAGALALFISTAFKSRVMSAVAFAVIGLLVFGLFVTLTNILSAFSRGLLRVGGSGFTGAAVPLTVIGFAVALWLLSVVNLILLAENRLSLPTEDSVTPLRLGFLAQFLTMAAWALVYLNDARIVRPTSGEVFAVAGCLHLTIVAILVVTEELTVPRRVLQRIHTPSRWRWLLAAFGPGAGRGAAYVLAQMAILLAVVYPFDITTEEYRAIAAACGYICFFTGVPVLMMWRFAPKRAIPIVLRLVVLVFIAAAALLPDILHYAIVRSEVLDLSFDARHLINPFRTIANWHEVESTGWTMVPCAIGATGVLAYLALIRLGARATARPVAADPIDPRPAPVEGATGRGDVAY